jgi:small subunit ribosomal protein S26e
MYVVIMGKKRKSSGRAKGQSGKGKSVQCDKCGRTVPVDKVKKRTKRTNLVSWELEQELRKEEDFIGVSGATITQKLCVSCAVHTGKVKIRAKKDRKNKRKQY